MTSQTRATLKGYFNTNDQPTEAQFADLIDSGLNLADETNWTLGSGVDEYALCYDHDTARFVLRSLAALDANGNLQLAAARYIYQGNSPLLHNYTATGTAGKNLFLGLDAGNFTMAGSGNEASGNTGIGANVLTALTTGSWNTAFGVNTMIANTTGISNTALGAGAMYRNISGSQNVAIGDTAMGENVSGGYNVAIGDSALQNGVTGSYNTAVGQGALASTTESSNAGVGVNALFYNTIGVGNTAVGPFSGMSLSDVNRNTISDYYMTFVGYKASRSASVSNTQQLVNAMALGYDAQVDESNKIVIGNTSVTKTVLRGNVGIGTTAPATALHVVGAATITGGIRPAADSVTALQLQNAAGTSVLNVDTTNGRVGIGTAGISTFVGKLQVVGADAFAGGAGGGTNALVNVFSDTAAGAGVGATLVLGGETGNSLPSYAFGGIRGAKETGSGDESYAGYLSFYSSVTAGQFPERMRIDGAGNVGIGTTAPAEKLDVTGNINTTGVVKVDDVQVLSNRVIDARCADVANSGDATTDGLIDALRDAMIAHGLIAASA